MIIGGTCFDLPKHTICPLNTASSLLLVISICASGEANLEAFEVNCATDTVTVGARAANVKDLESDPLELEADGQLNQPTRYVRVGVVAIVDPVLDGCDFSDPSPFKRSSSQRLHWQRSGLFAKNGFRDLRLACHGSLVVLPQVVQQGSEASVLS